AKAGSSLAAGRPESVRRAAADEQSEGAPAASGMAPELAIRTGIGQPARSDDGRPLAGRGAGIVQAALGGGPGLARQSGNGRVSWVGFAGPISRVIDSAR